MANSVERKPIPKEEMMTRSRDIEWMVPYWDKTDAIVEGFDAIRAEGVKYLPQFADETDTDYSVRLKAAKFTNIYRDVLEGLASKPFEEEVTLIFGKGKSKPPEELEKFVEDVDGSGNSLTIYAAQTFFNGINSAIDWIFIDYPTTDNLQIRTVADQKAAGVRPFWSHVLGRNILSARSKIINGKEVLSYIKIYEPDVNGKDRVRILEMSDTGQVYWEVWALTNKGEYVLDSENVLTIPVIPLVPFITGRRDGKSFKFYPPMRDAADLQIILYQDESALQHIKTLAGYPMLAANGLKPQLGPDNKTPLKVGIGPMKVLYGLPDNNGNHGTWNYIEPSATSMTFLQSSIKETKQDLRELGRQPLTAQSGQLTVITTAVAAGKAKSAVAAWALQLKDSLENALKITAMWMNIDYDPEVNVFTEFDGFAEGDQDLTALTEMRKERDLSQETYWSEMKRRKVLSPEFDADDERERLLEEIPGDGEDTTDETDVEELNTLKNPANLPGKAE